MDKLYTLPSTSLDLSEFDPRDRWDVWKQFNAGLFEVAPNIPDQNAIVARSTAYSMGDTIVGRYAHSGNYFHRGSVPTPLNRQDLLVLLVHKSGTFKGTLNNADTIFSSGHLTLFDFHQTIDAKSGSVDYISFVVPHEAIGYDPSKHPRLLQIPTDSPTGLVLLKNMETILEIAPTGTVHDLTLLGNGFNELLRGLLTRKLGDLSATEDTNLSYNAAICRMINQKMRHPALTPEALCQMAGLSHADLVKMFANEGGINQAILTRRLEHAWKDLSLREPKRGTIAQVARSWGFTDNAQFTREFRAAFGERPSEVLGSGLVPVPLEWGAARQEVQAQSRFEPLINLYGVHDMEQQSLRPCSRRSRAPNSNSTRSGAPFVDAYEV
jgi:AraC-like DNA-binding protein